LSAARSLIFNAALARRVDLGTWAQLLPGDVANLDGSASFFSVEAVDTELTERLQRFDIHPSGPLWGKGELPSGGEPQRIERDAAAALQPVADLLVSEGLRQERRALRAAVRDLELGFDGNSVLLEFFLNRGQFATTVLREICDFESPTPVEEFAE
jgi:tRNA pseudouridine13 synthase